MLHEPLRAVGRQSTLLHAVQHGGVSCTWVGHRQVGSSPAAVLAKQGLLDLPYSATDFTQLRDTNGNAETPSPQARGPMWMGCDASLPGACAAYIGKALTPPRDTDACAWPGLSGTKQRCYKVLQTLSIWSTEGSRRFCRTS